MNRPHAESTPVSFSRNPQGSAGVRAVLRLAAKLVLLLAPLTAPPLVRAQTVEVNWRRDYNAARLEAKTKGLPMVLDFGTKNCFFCQKMDSTTFREPGVVGLMNKHFIPLKIDAEEESVLKVVQELGINAYPTFVLASSDGNILDKFEGYKDAPVFQETLQRTLASLTPPEWMARDYDNAEKWLAKQEFAPAITALRRIIADGGTRPVQAKAQKLLESLEGRARERVVDARKLQDKGQLNEAMQALTLAMRDFPGLNTTREAGELLGKLAQSPQIRQEQRSKRAQELLTQARDYHRNKEYTLCVDRCSILMRSFGDLTEGQQGAQLYTEIKSDPEWLQNACDTFGDRLAEMYLALAESHLKRGQPQQAKHFLERTIRAFPGTHHAESAQIRLEQLQGAPTRRVDFQGTQ
jgi:thioredoxin-like negative regulator of GroEL